MFKSSRVTLFKKLFRNLFLSLVGVLATCLLLELTLRLYLHYRPYAAAKLFLESDIPIPMDLVASDGRSWISHGDDTDYKFMLHPYLYYKNLPNQHDTDICGEYHVNSLGFRGEEVAREKDPDVFRVIVVGGSTAFGYGATNDAATWSHRLQEKLNTCASMPGRVEVINAAVIGYGVAQEFLALYTELLDLAPDLVIAFDGYNDFYGLVFSCEGCTKPVEGDLDGSSFFGLASALLEEHSYEQDTPLSSQIWTLLVSMATRTYTGKFFYKRIEALKGRASAALFRERPDRVLAAAQPPAAREPDIDFCRREIDRHYKKHLRKMARLVNGRNIPLLIALQPELSLKKEQSEQEKAHVAVFDAQCPWGYSKMVAHVYPELAAAAAAVAAESPMTTFLDLTGIFGSRSEDRFTDVCHLNDDGNEVVAQFLFDHLCRP
jgi:hypothetical protein